MENRNNLVNMALGLKDWIHRKHIVIGYCSRFLQQNLLFRNSGSIHVWLHILLNFKNLDQSRTVSKWEIPIYAGDMGFDSLNPFQLRRSLAQTQLPHHSVKLHHQSPLILQQRNKPLSSQPLPTPISRAQIRLPLSADIGPNQARVTFTRFGPSFGTSNTPRLMRQQPEGFRSRDAQSK